MRTLKILWIQARTAALLSVQYRLDFVLGMVMALFWSAIALFPLLVLFDLRKSVAGWTWPEAFVVIGFFTALKGVMSGLMQPSMFAVVEHIRKGTLDFFLLKPVDAQLILSTARLDLSRTVDFVAGMVLVLIGVLKSGAAPGVFGVLLGALLFLSGAGILYSMWILAVSTSFFVVKIDNLSYLLSSTFDAARWPASVFRGALAFVFTFVIPLALMTTHPALALLARIDTRHVLISFGTGAFFLLASRMVWVRSVKRYTGAGG